MIKKVANLRRAVANLLEALAEPIVTSRDLGGVVKAFECAYELAWTCLKAHLEAEGHPCQGARDVFRTAWQLGMLSGDDGIWHAMIVSRNLTVHTYDADFARKLVQVIQKDYLNALQGLTSSLSTWHAAAK